MSNAKNNKPQVASGGIHAMDSLEKRVSLALAPVYHALNENTTILFAARVPFTQPNSR